MKIGDMVELSAAGKRNNHNSNYNREGAYGIVMEILTNGAQFPVKCQWFGGYHENRGMKNLAPFKAYELKRKRK
tara:strand:- start:122 stop:343 length:222 start_codon:yes stop_codon:yes gene_type:complete